MRGGLVLFIAFTLITIAFGYWSGKVSNNGSSWPYRTAVHVTFITCLVLTLLLLMRVVARFFQVGGAQ